MKRQLLFMAVWLFSALMFIMCRDQSGTGNIKSQAYIKAFDGASVKKSAETGSETICVIPFGALVDVTGKTAPGRPPTGWVKARWVLSEGWIKNDRTGDIRSVQDRIIIAYNSDRGHVSENVVKSFDGLFTVTGMYYYSGGAMEPATMIFLSNGILALNSAIFSETRQVNFFRYEFLSEGRLLKIYFSDDRRISFDAYSVVEKGNSTVFKIDVHEKSIIYQVKDKGINFFNWIFREGKTCRGQSM